MAYKTTCKQCGGDNFYVTPENGLGYCFNCAYTERNGEAQGVERYHDIKAIRELYTMLTLWYHTQLTDQHVDYLSRRGITNLQKYAIGFVPDTPHVLYQSQIAIEAGIADRLYKPRLSNRIVFPYIVNSIVTDIRGRTIISDPRKYLSPKGTGYYRGADYPYLFDQLTYNEVVITEGEIKALASVHAGIPAIGLPGILSLRPKVTQREDQTFIVCFDNQTEHYIDVIRAIVRIGERFNNVKIATLPLKGERKQDIDSFLLRYGAEEYYRVIRRAIWFSDWKKLIRL